MTAGPTTPSLSLFHTGLQGLPPISQMSNVTSPSLQHFCCLSTNNHFGSPNSSFLPPGSFKWHCWKPPRGRCTRGNTHHCQPVTTQRKANMSVYATRTTTRKTQAHSADAGWACAPLRGAGGTCPFKIYFSQLVGAELSGLA